MMDPPRPDAKQTVAETKTRPSVKMVTGDDVAIGEIAAQLGLASSGGRYLRRQKAWRPRANRRRPRGRDRRRLRARVPAAQIRDRESLAVAWTYRGHDGDGVNDAPALKQADCGIAVSGATDAARDAAALILTAPGLSTIVNAIIEARQIFQRITSYVYYRIAGRALLEEDLRSPCAEEIAVFQAFSRILGEAAKKFVIMDTAPPYAASARRDGGVSP